MAASSESRVPGWLATAGAYAWRFIGIAASLYVLGVVFSKLHLIVIPVVAALFFTCVLAPPAHLLRRHGVPRLAATWIVFLGALLIVAGIIAGLIPSISGQFTQLGHDLDQGVRHVQHWLETGPLHLSKRQVTNDYNNLKKQVTSNSRTIARYGLTGATAILQSAAVALLTLVLSFFFVNDGEQIAGWLASIPSENHAADVRAIGRDAWGTLGGYVRGTAVNGIVNAALLMIGLLILGVPLVIPIGLLTFVGSFLPLVGAIASGLIAALVALVAKGPVAALIVVGLTVLIHNVEGYLVGPLVLGRAVRLHPVAVLLSLSVGTAVGGILGAFLAVPLVAVLLTVHGHYRRISRHVTMGPTPAPGPLYLAEEPPPPGTSEPPPRAENA